MDNSENRRNRAVRYEMATEQYQKALRSLQQQHKMGLISVYDYTVSRNKNELQYKKAVNKINKEIKQETQKSPNEEKV